MSFHEASVVFDGSSQGVLYSGREITGAFHLKLYEAKKVKGLYYKITGKSKTQWSEAHGSANNCKTVYYSGHATHIDTGPMTLVAGHPIKKGCVVIEEGLNKFNFSFTLPPAIPSSFEGAHGKIEYEMIVVAERPRKVDKSKTFPFTVVCSTDLNLNLENTMPLREILTKKISSNFADQGSLEMIIDLPILGYIPGQQLPIKCFVKNNSGVIVTCVNFSLERIATYFSNNVHQSRSSTTESSTIVEYIGAQVDRDAESLLEVVLSIPALPTSTPEDALITMQYFVTVRAVTKEVLFNLDTQIPVTIGTIPVYTPSWDSTLPAFSQQPMNIHHTGNYPCSPDFSQIPAFGHIGFPPSRSQYSWPTPTDNSGLPTYEESQMPETKSRHSKEPT